MDLGTWRLRQVLQAWLSPSAVSAGVLGADTALWQPPSPPRGPESCTPTPHRFRPRGKGATVSNYSHHCSQPDRHHPKQGHRLIAEVLCREFGDNLVELDLSHMEMPKPRGLRIGRAVSPRKPQCGYGSRMVCRHPVTEVLSTWPVGGRIHVSRGRREGPRT